MSDDLRSLNNFTLSANRESRTTTNLNSTLRAGKLAKCSCASPKVRSYSRCSLWTNCISRYP